MPSKKSRKSKKVKAVCKEKFEKSSKGMAIYGMGFIGAAVYYVSTAPDVWGAIVGLVKAIFWPAFLVHGAMAALGL